MGVLGCGLNTSGQLVKGGPGVLCCPTPVTPSAPGTTAARVAFSHILWRTDSGWRWTGHDAEGSQARGHIKSSWKVCVCENRIAAINDAGSVLVWEKQWRTLHFQKRDHDDETHNENLLQKNHRTDVEEKESTNIDISVKYDVKQLEPESTKRKDIEISTDDNVPNTERFEKQEIKNKRCKLETLTKREYTWPASDHSCPQKANINFAKVAVEDNSLLALDSDGVMYCGTIPVPLRMRVRDVAVGKEHSMALTATGDIITWGSGMRGQLGIGELCQVERPVPVEGLQGIPITTIACGAWHCAALSRSGDLYVWGWNESGQLGFPYNCEGSQSLFNFFEHSCQCPKSDSKQDTDDHWEREQLQNQQLHVEESQESKDIEESNTAQREAKSEEMQDRRINPERRREVINVEASPVLMDFWTEDVSVTDVQCGDRHTLYMLDDGSVWSAGMNRYGQLGLGHVRAVKEPCRVFRRGIRDVCAGGWNSIFLTTTTTTTTTTSVPASS